jgi:hypothetical protein
MGRFSVEEEGPIPAALSHLLFGAPVGFADTGLLRYFRTSTAGSAAEAVERAAHGEAVPTHVRQMPLDGIGIGPPLSATIAFALFGSHARSLLLLFLALLGLSTASYVLRFRHERLWIAPVFLGALTVMLLTRATEMPPTVAEAPLGGERSYILLALLPTLHWCFELVAGASRSRREALNRGLLLGVQVTILGVAILVRYSPVCLIPAVLVSAVLGLRYGSARRAALLCLLPLAGVLISLYAVVPAVFPDQAASGRLQSLIWHRAFVSYGLNPDWPFPGVAEQYACPQIPGGITHRGTDGNGHCVWFAAAMNQSRPEAEVWAGIYGTQYELVMRDAFFDVVTHYPRETLATFFYYKPLKMIDATAKSLIPGPAIPPSVGALALLQFLLLGGFLATERAPGRGIKPKGGVTIVAALVVSASVPHFLAWTNPAVGQELAVGAAGLAIVGVWLGCRAALRFLQGRARSSEDVFNDRGAGA